MDFVAGSIAGATGQLVGHPLDSIKTRLQSESLLARGTNSPTTATSAYKCARNIYNEGGFRAFFRGLSLPLCSKSFEQCIAFGIQSAVDQLLEGMDVDEGTLRTGLSGMAAGSTTSLLLTPIYLVKVQLQVTPKGSLSGPISVIKRTINKLGFSGLYTGAVPIFIGTSIGYGCRFMAYDKATNIAEQSFGFGRIGSVIVGGGMAGMATWASHYPLDLVSSRMEASVALGGRQLTMTEHVKEIFAQSGVRGFFRGIGPCLLRAFPVNATIFLTYDLCKSNLM
mmetsp:Transcript_17764/g.29192  ORF Transcript_17764/g.29192 Transcript_17764/m.29192 type:complete len:281 (-) Transcript_17764:39-881(-)